MKHAYLIISHNEFTILTLLIQAIDDERNDIYIHFDRKVKNTPTLQTRKSNLYILQERIDVRWGDYSQIETELKLFSSALQNGPYLYYHLLSGVDLPLKSQDVIHSFFEKNQGKEFIGFHSRDISKEVEKRAQIYHLFPRNFRSSNNPINTAKKLLRYCYTKTQLWTGFRRNKNIEFKQGHNWVSVTNNFVVFLIDKKEWIKKTFQHSFCCDEVYKHTLCWNSHFRNNLFDITNEYRGCMRLFNWHGNEILSFEEKDVGNMLKSEFLFARKYSECKITAAHKTLNAYGK